MFKGFPGSGQQPTFFFDGHRLKIDTKKVAALADGVAQDELVELIDVEIATEGPRSLIRIFIDREGGVRLRDCESFSRKLGAILDVEDPVAGPYSLEVSSPGGNRRLSQPTHFTECRGARVLRGAPPGRRGERERARQGRQGVPAAVPADAQGEPGGHPGRTIREGNEETMILDIGQIIRQLGKEKGNDRS